MSGQNFMDVLAGFIPAARDTDMGDDGFFIPKGEKCLALVKAEFEPGTNDYGSYVKATLGWSICDIGEDQDREFQTVDFINLTKDGKLSIGGQNIVRIAGVLAGEPIADNDPQNAAAVIQGAVGNSAIRARCSARKDKKTGNEYPRIRPLSLEATAPQSA